MLSITYLLSSLIFDLPKFLIIAVDILFALILIPISREYFVRIVLNKGYYSKAKKVWISVALLVSISLFAFITYQRFSDGREFKHFSVEEYSAEIEIALRNGTHPKIRSLDIYNKRFLKEIYEHALYRALLGDYEESIKRYNVINEGQYHADKIIIVPSACVKTNLAISLFLQHPGKRDVLSKCALLFDEAKKLAKGEEMAKCLEQINYNYYLMFVK